MLTFSQSLQSVRALFHKPVSIQPAWWMNSLVSYWHVCAEAFAENDPVFSSPKEKQKICKRRNHIQQTLTCSLYLESRGGWRFSDAAGSAVPSSHMDPLTVFYRSAAAKFYYIGLSVPPLPLSLVSHSLPLSSTWTGLRTTRGATVYGLRVLDGLLVLCCSRETALLDRPTVFI